MSRSIRWLLVNRRGRVEADLRWHIISRFSAVHVSASEVTPLEGDEISFGFGIRLPTRWRYEIGAADVWVSNISPRDGRVTFILHVDWHLPLHVMMTITVEDRLIEQELGSRGPEG